MAQTQPKPESKPAAQSKRAHLILGPQDLANERYLLATTPYTTRSALIRHLLAWHAKRVMESQKGVTLLINRSGSIREIEL